MALTTVLPEEEGQKSEDCTKDESGNADTGSEKDHIDGHLEACVK